jgi:hypothetical protein
VKQFAQHMVDDHSKTNDELAAQKKVTRGHVSFRASGEARVRTRTRPYAHAQIGPRDTSWFTAET